MLIHGSCHCGNIAFTLTWEPEPERISARACGCTFCRKHGGVWTSNPSGALRVALRDPDGVSRYSFATGSGRFHVCGRCGAVPVVTGDIEGRTYAVVNVNTFDNVNAPVLDRAATSFDGETLETRLARWKRNWIPDVKFEGIDQ
ncbi:MAG TPA: hypothetical protein VH040_10560 [Usitatibacter sp.]|jgi:hypothetical protein|nr:hypothetical protein [Usitatibacter sp.]